MSISNKEWYDLFMAAHPGLMDWEKTFEEIGKRFPKLHGDEQVKVAEKLGGFLGEEGVAEAVEKLYGSGKAGLLAMISLSRSMKELGRPVEEGLAEKLEAWSLLCDESESSCDPAEFFSFSGPAQKAVVEHLTDWMRPDLLAALKDAAPSREKAKELAKALHKAKSAGAVIKDESGEKFIMAERDEYVDEAYMSPPDPEGTTFIYLFRTIFGKNTLAVALINDEEGVLKFDSYQVSVARFQKMLESTKRNPHAVIVKVDASFARRLIAAAEKEGTLRGKVQEQGYLSSRRAIGVADEPEGPHLVWDLLNREEIAKEKGLAARSAELLSHRLFEDWMIEPLVEGRVMAEIEDMQTSPIELSASQRLEREMSIYEREAKDLLDIRGRDLYAGRLFNCAVVLFRIGDEEEARVAAAAGLAALDRESAPPRFFVELLKRTVDRHRSEDDGGPKGPDMDRGGIVSL